jgi:hypothetical protein
VTEPEIELIELIQLAKILRKIVRGSINTLLPMLNDITNKSFQLGCMPEQLKKHYIETPVEEGLSGL